MKFKKWLNAEWIQWHTLDKSYLNEGEIYLFKSFKREKRYFWVASFSKIGRNKQGEERYYFQLGQTFVTIHPFETQWWIRRPTKIELEKHIEGKI